MPSRVRRGAFVFGFFCLLLLLPLAGAQKSKLSRTKVEQLVQIQAPDDLLASQIRSLGLSFAVDSKTVDAFAKLGAGPLTLGVIEEFIPKPSSRPGPTSAAGSPGNTGKPPIVSGDPIHACVLIGKQDYSRQITSDDASWIQLNRGQERNGYSFADNGGLFYSGQMLTNNIPVTGGNDNHWVYAQSVALSPKSPSGRFSMLQACEEPNLGGLCWALFVVDHSSMHMERTSAGKYGPDRWVAWIRGDDEYAVLRYSDDGQTTYYRIHLPTGESTDCGAMSNAGSGVGESNAFQFETSPSSGAGIGFEQGNGNSGNTGGIYQVGGRVSAPAVIHSVEARFSDVARKAKYQGVCIVALIVDTQGNPQNVHVIRSLGMGLDENAVEAVKQYKFRPAMLDGETPVPVAITVQIGFHLY